MDFLLDPRVWVPFTVLLLGFVGAWARNESTVKTLASDVAKVREHELGSLRRDHSSELGKAFEKIRKVEDQHDLLRIDVVRLQEGHKSQGEKLENVVDQLKQVVIDLQQVAIKLAVRG